MAAKNVFKYNERAIARDEHVVSIMEKILSGTLDKWKEFIENDEELLRYLEKAVTELVTYYETNAGQEVLPFQANQILAALNYCEPEDVKVIILGHDPVRAYCKGQPLATGLAFSYPQGITEEDVNNMIIQYKKKHPDRHEEPGRSVLDVHQALREAGIEPGESCCHEHWAERGVLLLNACPTIDPDSELVKRNGQKENPHFKYWESFIYNLLSTLLQKIREEREDVAPVYVLCWGTHAKDVGRNLRKLDDDNDSEWDDDHAGLLHPRPVIIIGHHPTFPDPDSSENKFIGQATNQFKAIKRYPSYSALFNQEEG